MVSLVVSGHAINGMVIIPIGRDCLSNVSLQRLRLLTFPPVKFQNNTTHRGLVTLASRISRICPHLTLLFSADDTI